MLAQSQGRNEQVVNAYNLFIDSAKDVGGAAGKGLGALAFANGDQI